MAKVSKASKVQAPKVTTTFALVDIKGGRAALHKLVHDHKHKVPVVLSGHIIGDWSGDDGTSIEFEIAVTDYALGKPLAQVCHCVRCEART